MRTGSMCFKRWCVAGSLWCVPIAAAAKAPSAVGGRPAIPPSAVAATLAQAGLSVPEARLHLPGSLSSETDTPELKITAAEQRANGSLSVRFACRSAVECMPFFVTVDPADDRPALAAFAERMLAQHQAAGTSSARSDRAAVAIGAHVTLQLTDAQMRIQLPAVAIDTGAPGAEVRVASLDRKHTWRGVVIDATTVRGGVQ